ncbi:hypothetical protein RCC89_13100 [Cytophagaceae bacterium ABcell3]|nr:hypothetical protein RCC89_13100 [Cytophagaceae bacterium ABcell3]
MRVIFFSFLIFLSSSVLCNAQTEKGSYMVGGHGYASFTNGFSMLISPNIGYFLADGFVLGAGPSLTVGSFTGHKSYSGGLNLFSRYYIGLTQSLQMFGQVHGTLRYTHQRVDMRYFFDEDHISISNSFRGKFGGGLGLAYFFTEQVSLEALFRYDRINDRSRKNFFTLDLGFQIYFPRK